MTIPTASFLTSGPKQIADGGGPADANVAVSSTHVVVTGRNAFACFAKDGTPVAPAPGLEARRYLVEEFFPALGTPVAAIPPPPGGYGSPGKDGRVVFDQHRKRFFMTFQGRQLPPILFIAVSKSENPADGWYTYGDDVLIHDPVNGDINGHDYQWLGINGDSLLVCNGMGRNVGVPYQYPPNWKSNGTLAVFFDYDANALASGNPHYTRKRWLPSTSQWVVPCVHDSYTTDQYWVSRDDLTHMTVWGVRNGVTTSKQVTIQPSVAAVNGPLPGGAAVDYGHIIFNAPTNAEYRDGKIVTVSNEGHVWQGQTAPNAACRLVRLNVSKLFDPGNAVTVEIDRIFGRAASDDPAGQIFDYGWPAVSTNSRGDIVIGAIRSNATTYTQFRGSVWFAGDPDISSSMPLSSSVGPLTEFHMAGAAADRSTGGVVVAQEVQETAGQPYQIRIASILSGQPNWRYCSHCQGLYFLGNAMPTHCPVNGTHLFTQSYDYCLHIAGQGPAGQDNWRWCNKCAGLSFAGNGPPRKCPMGGNHDLTGSGDYSLVQNIASLPPQMQNQWRWCNKCMSLYYGGSTAPTVCLEGGSHSDVGSGNYALEWIPNP